MQRLLLLILFGILTNSVFARQDKLISVDLQHAGIKEFSSELEKQSGFHFFYDPLVMDSLKVTIKADRQTLSAVLTQALKNTSYNFVIVQSQVFLTKNQVIRTEVAAGYLPVQKIKQTVSADNEQVFNDDKNAAVASIENKLYEIGVKTNNLKSGQLTLSGYVKNMRSGEPVANANIFISDLKVNIRSDQSGFYSITMSPGAHNLQIKAPSIKDTHRQVMLYASGRLNIALQEQILTVQEVVISSRAAVSVRSTEMGLNKIDVKELKQVPTVFGEADVLKVVLTLPGVQSVGEASAGFNVRGGAADQNLILLNESTIYNPSHFFGFFSNFNPDIVKDVELYKSSIPEKFGGRLSSVLDVSNREGNKSKFTGTAGIGLITSRLNIEGPIDSGKTSFILGGRTTYSNWMLELLPQDYKNSKASFSDLSLGIDHQFNASNSINFSGYFSTDRFKLNSDTTYGYGNRNASLKWKHNFSTKFFGTFVLGADRYQYNINSDSEPVRSYDLKFDINQTNFKSDFIYYLNPKHTLNFGIGSVYYRLNPGNYKPIGKESLIMPDVIAQEKALESNIYLGDKFESGNFAFSAGLRYSLYNFLGPQRVNNYLPGVPKTVFTQSGTTDYGNNEVVKTYKGPEIRLSARYSVTKSFSIKAAYNTLRQYIHLLSNTTAIAPTDIYKLSDPNIKPQLGSQVSLGLYKNFNANTLETSVEVYYKKLEDYLDYKSGAVLVLNHHIETDVINTRGKAYGVEFFVRKSTGKINGWLSYAFSRTFLKMDDPLIGQVVNGGNFYPANYDKPHAFNFTGNYRFTHRYSLSVNMTYSTGRPITLPVAKYSYAGTERLYYSDRNAYRIPDYFRTDVSFNIEGNHNVKQLTHNSWNFGVYNLTGRQNAFSTYFTSENGVVNGYKLSIFASIIPFVNYNIRF